MIKQYNNKIKIVVIFFLIFGVLWLGNLYLDIRSANKVEQVKIDIDTDNEIFDKINAYRISPINFESSLIKDSNYKSFYSNKRKYLKRIKITIPSNDIGKVKKIKINIGKKEFVFTKEELLNKWDNKIKSGVINLFSPDYVRSSKSILPRLNVIINWTGDFNVFIKSFILTLVFCCFMAAVFFIFFDIFAKKYYTVGYWLIFAGIIFFALIQRITINQVPYGGNDTWGYIGPAVLWFDKGAFFRVGSRGILYPLFVLINLIIFNDFSYITIIQHIIGIISGVILFLVWRNIISYFRLNNKMRLICDMFGLLLMALFLFSESMIVYEHTLRPESIYPFFLILQVYFLCKLIISIKENTKHVYLYGPLFFLNNYFLFVFQPRWGLTVILNLIVYIICFIVIKRSIIKKSLILLIVPIILAFVLIYAPQNILIKNETATKSFLSGMIFFAHSKIIDKQLEKDIKDNNFIKYDKEILKKLRGYYKEEFNKKQTKHKYLGFLHNNFYYGPANKYLRSKIPKKEYKQFCIYYFKKAIFNNPFMYFKKVLLELSQFYNFYGGMYPARKFKVDRDGYWEAGVTRLAIQYVPYRSYQNIRYKLETTYYDFDEIRFPGIQLLYLILSRTYILCFLVFFFLFIRKIIKVFKNREFGNNFLFGIIIFVMFMYNFCISLTNSMIYCLDVARYIDDQFIIVLFSQILAIYYIIYNFYSGVKTNTKISNEQ